jgi:hypothetical protein
MGMASDERILGSRSIVDRVIAELEAREKKT